jgi:hypothetical protein
LVVKTWLLKLLSNRCIEHYSALLVSDWETGHSLLLGGYEMEIWKDIEGYEGLYKVSNTGKVLGVKREKELTQHENHRGYLKVSLQKDGKRKNELVHRLVAKAFLENTEELPQVNHKDGTKTNNHVENLEWSSQSENMKHAVEKGLLVRPKGESCYNAKLTNEDAQAIRERYAEGGTSHRKLAKEFGVSAGVVHNILSGRSYVTK